VEVRRRPDAGDRLGVTFVHAMFDGELVGDLCLEWRPSPRAGDSGPTLSMARPDLQGGVLLDAWPTDPAGGLASHFEIPLGHGMNWRSRVRQWSALGTRGRALVTGLADALASCSLQPDGDEAAARNTWLREAQALRSQALRLEALFQLRGGLLALRGRNT
jgi:hypothetical protein